MYFAESESTLATSAVKEGRPSDPGAGWMTSAPKFTCSEQGEFKDNQEDIPITMVGLLGSLSARADAASGTTLMPPIFTFILFEGLVRR
jgi:hypothetical protein